MKRFVVRILVTSCENQQFVPPMLYVNGTAGQYNWNIGLRTTGLPTPDRVLYKSCGPVLKRRLGKGTQMIQKRPPLNKHHG